ncbi:aldehyde ferredoxin oxidoreductase family protein [Spirochaetota bacterium]
MNEFYGNYLKINLSTGAVEKYGIDTADLRRFFGGGGLAAKIFIDNGDDQALVIANGLLTGYALPTACKTSMVFKSPQTGIFGETSVGGKWGARLKKTGVDGMIITGRAKTPVYIYVTDGTAEIRNAGHLWGNDTFETHRILMDELPRGSGAGIIGPAGERGVLFASVMFEGEMPRAAGRTGAGYVLGMKNIKALAVRGRGKPEPCSGDELGEYVRGLNPSILKRAQALHDLGTAGSVLKREQSGDLPIKNFSQDKWKEGAAKITGSVYADSMHLGHSACFHCPIACAKKITCRGLRTSQPEYESVAALGSNLLIDNPEDVIMANMLCNKLGIDTISAGVVMGFLFECRERGIIRESDFDMDEHPFAWGRAETVMELIEKIAFRQGIGDVLSRGVKSAAEYFGGGAEQFAMHAKGLELPMHDPRSLVSSAVTYATGNRGGSHNESFAFYVEQGLSIEGMGFDENVDPHTSIGKGELTGRMQNLNAVFDALGLCKFLLSGGMGTGNLLEFIRLVTGWEMDSHELLSVGDRIYTLKRIYNQKLGVSRKNDCIPHRLLFEKKGHSDAADVLPDLDTMVEDLYSFRGWDKNGQVTFEKAQSIGLESYLR